MASVPWGILLCKFSDQPVEPNPPDFYRQLFMRPGEGLLNLADYFTDASCHTLDMSENQVFGWLELDHPRSDYIGSGAVPDHRRDLLVWGSEAAARAGIDLTPFPVIGILTNVNADLTGELGWFTADGSIVDIAGYAHEMGHAMGLDHSRIEGSTEEYMDPWDIMSWDSNVFDVAHPDPRLGGMGPGMNVANADALGWMASRTATGKFNVVELRPRHRWDLQGFLAAQVGPFLVEFRTPDRWDGAIGAPVVLVHTYEAGHSYLMRSVAGSAALGEGSYIEKPLPSQGVPYRVRIAVEVIDAANNMAAVSVKSFLPGVPGLGGGGTTPK